MFQRCAASNQSAYTQIVQHLDYYQLNSALAALGITFTVGCPFSEGGLEEY